MAKEKAAFTVEMGEEFYSIAPQGGNSGAPVPYGETACVRVNNIVHYCHVEDPNDYPEGGEAPEVYMVEAAVVVSSEMAEVDDEDEEEQQSGPTVVDEEDEEDEDEDEEDEEQLGPELVEEEEDENLPPAEDQR